MLRRRIIQRVIEAFPDWKAMDTGETQMAQYKQDIYQIKHFHIL
jgi:hypothetical protein